MKTGKPGSISHGTLRPEDLIPTFGDELESLILLNGDWLAKPEWHGKRDGLNALREDARAYDAATESAPENGPELVNELIDALQEFAPDYCYFGAHPGDGSDFGFWLYEDWQEMARDDGVTFVSDLSELPDDLPGGLVCVVNDHGNATLYAQDCEGVRREIWGIV